MRHSGSAECNALSPQTGFQRLIHHHSTLILFFPRPVRLGARDSPLSIRYYFSWFDIIFTYMGDLSVIMTHIVAGFLPGRLFYLCSDKEPKLSHRA